jgi:glutathione peroxidase
MALLPARLWDCDLHSKAMFKPILFFALLAAGASAQASNFCAGLASYPVQPLIGGKAFDLCKLDAKAAKAVLVVNTASQCGFTPQYEGLEKLHQRFKAQGLMVVGIPANDFGSQEKGSNKEIAQFCQMNFGVSFTVGSKLEMPITKDPLFAKLAASSGKSPGWNFHKYLINAKGQVQSFDSAVEPLAAPLVTAVQTALKP